MKILMVNKFLYARGGAETYMLKVGAFLESLGHDVQYFGMYDAQNTVGNRIDEYTSNMDFHEKRLSRFLYPFRILYSREAYQKITKVLEDFNPDIVHFNNINFQLTPSIIDAVYKKKIPMIMTVHDYQMICPNHSLYSIKDKKPCEKCIHGNVFHCMKGKCIHSSTTKSILGVIEYFLYRIRKNYKKIDLYICPSKFLESRLLLSRSKVYKGKTKVMCNYAKIPDLTEIEKISKIEKKDYVLFAGRLSKEKGVEVLAETAKLLPDIQFVVAGDGPDKKVLENIKNVHLKGFVSGNEFFRLIAEAKFEVVPSICYENCPISILEAQAMGTPVVTAGVGGMAELVEDGITGLHVKPMTAEALAETISQLLNNDEKLNELTENCIKKADEIVTLENYTRELFETYTKIIRGK